MPKKRKTKKKKPALIQAPPPADAFAVARLARAGRISPRAIGKMKGANKAGRKGVRGSAIPTRAPRGGVAKGMAGM